MLCYTCNDDILQGDELHCILCKEFFHFICGGFREEKFRKLNKLSKEKWNCSSCKSNKGLNKLGNICKTPVKNGANISEETLNAVVESVNFMSAQFDTFGQQLKDLVSSITELKIENKQIKEENLMLKKEVSNLSHRVNILEQSSLDCHFEIAGVPECKNEICINTVQKITAKLGINVPLNDVFRIPSKVLDKPRKISACCNSVQDKRKILELAKKEKLVAKDIDFNWKDTALYFNEQMTTTYRKLFFKAKTVAKEKKYKYVWFKNNRIFVKKDDSTKAITIYDETSVLKIV